LVSKKYHLGIVPKTEPVRRPRVWFRGAASSHLHAAHPDLLLAVRSIDWTHVHRRDTNNEGHDMNVTKVIGFAAVGALLILAAPIGGAQAMTLNSPGAAAVAQDSSRSITTEVGWHHHHRHWGHWHRHGWHR
jgi:hypothetical protein